ncbi:MAG: HAD family hydrolase [Anaerolineae bacterium]
MALKAVIFDMDATLVDWSKRSADFAETRRSHLQKLYDYLVAAGHRLPDVNEFGKVYVRVLMRRWNANDPLSSPAPRFGDALREILDSFALSVDALDFDHLQTLVVGMLQAGVTAYPDAAGVLETLRAAGIRTGLLTNAPYPMFIRETELSELKLIHLLDVYLSAEDVGYQKPHPAAFAAVLERLGVTASEAIYVGDDLKDDVSGAQKAGMKAVWVSREVDLNPNAIIPDATIEQLAELPGILDQWFPGWREA